MIIVIVSHPQPRLTPQKLSQDHVTPLPMSGLLLADRPVSRSLIGLAASQVFLRILSDLRMLYGDRCIHVYLYVGFSFNNAR